jgi:ABC-type transporter Mla maintaining outer membrane lipid asymmetry permease subunit MlaE
MGPLFSGIILASRIGAVYTAELGAMTAGGALRYLAIPRFLAILFITPCLSILSTIFGASVISRLMLQLGYHYF